MNIGSMTLKMAKFLQCAFPIRLVGCLTRHGSKRLKTACGVAKVTYRRCVLSLDMTAETWKHLRDEFGVSGEASAKAVAWAIRTLVTDLERHH